MPVACNLIRTDTCTLVSIHQQSFSMKNNYQNTIILICIYISIISFSFYFRTIVYCLCFSQTDRCRCGLEISDHIIQCAVSALFLQYRNRTEIQILNQVSVHMEISIINFTQLKMDMVVADILKTHKTGKLKG